MFNGGRSHARGQLLLVFAVLVAVLIISAAAALNLASIAVQERTGGVDTKTDLTEDVYAELTMVGETTVQDVNHDPSIKQGEERRGRVVDQLLDSYDLLQSQLGQAPTGGVFSVSVSGDDVTMGDRIVQEEPSNGTSEAGSADWEPIADSDGIRELTVVGEDVMSVSSSTPFRVILETADETHDDIVVELTRSGDTLEIEYTNEAGEQAVSGVSAAEPFSIDYIGGTVNKGRLPGYAPTAAVESVRIENGDEIDEITYSMVADGAAISDEIQTGPSPVGDDPEEEELDPDEPLRHPAVYEVEIGATVTIEDVQNSQTIVLGEPEEF